MSASPEDVERLFDEASKLPREEQEAFVKQAAGGDLALAREVLELLAHDVPTSFLEHPGEALSDALLVDWKAYLGQVVDARYELRELMDVGGSGAGVFVADDLRQGGDVVVKMLPVVREADRTRIRLELSSLYLLQVPGVVRTLDEGIHDDRVFVVMERLHGIPFGAGSTPRAWEDVRETVIALLETLARVHAEGYVHNDLKPGNVLVDERGLPTVLDLGISSGAAAERRISGLAGTPAYLAPERVVGGAGGSFRGDLHAVGLLTLEALSGNATFQQTTVEEVLEAKRAWSDAEVARRLEPLPEAAARPLLQALLATDPEDRPASAHAALALVADRRARGPAWLEDDGEPLGEHDLQALFGGLERIHRIPSDAAHELWARTHGERPRVRQELAAWERAGLGGWEGDRYVLDRRAIDRLRDGLEVLAASALPTPDREGARASWHEERAASLPSGTRRLAHLVAAAGPEAVDEAIVVARKLESEQQPERAMRCVESVLQLSAVRAAPEKEWQALYWLLRTALQTTAVSVIERALACVRRRASVDSRFEQLEDLAQAARLAVQGDARACLAALGRPGDEVADVASMIRNFAMRSLPEDEAITYLRAEEGVDSPRVLTVRAWQHFGRGEYSDAARLHDRVLSADAGQTPRLSVLLNAALAHIEACNLQRGLELAEQLARLSVEGRHVFGAAYAERLVRMACYRRGDVLAPDAELVEAVAEIRSPDLCANTLLTEAAIAWRTDDPGVAVAVLARAQLIATSLSQLICRAFLALLHRTCQDDEWTGVVPRSLEGAFPSAAVQTLGLLAMGGRRLDRAEREHLHACADRIPRDHWPLRREVISVEESLKAAAVLSH